jgi:hypothetical protein
MFTNLNMIAMKKHLSNSRNLILVFIIGLTLISCTKKDKTATDNLVGTWTSGTPVLTITVGTRTLLQYFTDVMGLSASQAQIYVTTVNMSIAQSFTGTFTAKSDNTYTSNIGGEADSGTWALSADGKKLTIDSATSSPEIYDVVELTANKLTLSISQSESDDLNGDNIPETINYTIQLVFTK